VYTLPSLIPSCTSNWLLTYDVRRHDAVCCITVVQQPGGGDPGIGSSRTVLELEDSSRTQNRVLGLGL